MEEIYWLQRIGNVSTMCCIIFWMVVVAYAIMLFAMPIFGEDWNDDYKAMLKKWGKRLACVWFVSALAWMFIPSRTELYEIYGIGGTIDYIKSNDKAKELPDKVVDALTRYVDSIEEDKKSE